MRRRLLLTGALTGLSVALAAPGFLAHLRAQAQSDQRRLVVFETFNEAG